MADFQALREQIEELAVSVIATGCEEPAGRWIGPLERIRETATREGDEGTARIAGSALEAIRGSAASSPNRTAEVQAAIMQLQVAVGGCENDSPPPAQPLSEDRELLLDFILESREHLATIEAQVLLLERDPADEEAINAAFRAFHTIKGLAGFLELKEVQDLAHEVEAVLERIRNSELAVTPLAIDVFLASTDHLRGWLLHLEEKLDGKASYPPSASDGMYRGLRELTRSCVADAEGSRAEIPERVPPVATSDDSSQPPHASAVPEKSEERRREATAVRVDTGKLDYLVDMVGEMVITETLVRHDPELAVSRSPRLQRNLAQLTRITAELQKTAMAMRLVPVGQLFRRMARPARDLARQVGKEIEMITEDEEIELDRTIVEELADPLMHMVRNAIDHGVEGPDERVARGKTRQGRLLLKAQHRAGQVVIEIGDDGRGLNRQRIVETAIARGLITASDDLTDTAAYDLIFRPGFSTAAQVTNVSGRGVGMDVVRRHIEKLRGRVEIHSVDGGGATFSIKLPLTLAIIDGLVVGVGQERYIVPIFVVREMFRPKQESVWTVQQKGEMALVRGALLPVLRLSRKFQVAPCSDDPLDSVLVVVEVEGRRFCILVDELIGKQEVVIKGLGEMFDNVSGISGGAILGDGRVGLILDVDRLYKDRAGDGSH